MQSSRCDYCLPVVGPAAAPRGKGYRGCLSWWEEMWLSGNVKAIQGTSVGPSGLTQLGMVHLVGPSVGRRG
jgi:hypothetical protein